MASKNWRWHAHHRQQADDVDVGIRAQDPFCNFWRGGNALDVIEPPVTLNPPF